MLEQKLYSMSAWGKMGKTAQVGEMQMGDNVVGVQNAFISRCEFGTITPGDNIVGDLDEFNGIYQRRHSENGIVVAKQKWWVSKNPRTIDQQGNRSKFAEAIDEWHNLTDEERSFYNNESKGKRKTGFNIFIAEYMRT